MLVVKQKKNISSEKCAIDAKLKIYCLQNYNKYDDNNNIKSRNT